MPSFFNVELLTPQGFEFEADMKYFPLGGLHPTQKIPFGSLGGFKRSRHRMRLHRGSDVELEDAS